MSDFLSTLSRILFYSNSTKDIIINYILLIITSVVGYHVIHLACSHYYHYHITSDLNDQSNESNNDNDDDNNNDHHRGRIGSESLLRQRTPDGSARESAADLPDDTFLQATTTSTDAIVTIQSAGNQQHHPQSITSVNNNNNKSNNQSVKSKRLKQQTRQVILLFAAAFVYLTLFQVSLCFGVECEGISIIWSALWGLYVYLYLSVAGGYGGWNMTRFKKFSSSAKPLSIQASQLNNDDDDAAMPSEQHLAKATIVAAAAVDSKKRVIGWFIIITSILCWAAWIYYIFVEDFLTTLAHFLAAIMGVLMAWLMERYVMIRIIKKPRF